MIVRNDKEEQTGPPFRRHPSQEGARRSKEKEKDVARASFTPPLAPFGNSINSIHKPYRDNLSSRNSKSTPVLSPLITVSQFVPCSL